MKFTSVLAVIPLLALEALSVTARGHHHRHHTNHLERAGQNNSGRGGRFQPRPPRDQNRFGQRPGNNTGRGGKNIPPPAGSVGAGGNKGAAATTTSAAAASTTTSVAASITSAAAASIASVDTSTISADKGTGFEAGGGKNNNKGASASSAATSTTAFTTTTTAAAATSAAATSTTASTTTAAAASATTILGTAAPDNSKKVSPNDPSQSSLTLDPSQIGPNLAQDGQAVKAAGQVASLTSKNNYINFCKTTGQAITNGLQQTQGSCNPVPQGQIPAKNKMPSCKFVFPPNGGTVKANTDFTVQLAVSNMETGNFVNAQENYFSAPQQLNAQGVIIGHNHITIQEIDSLGSTKILDPEVFAFFKGLNIAAVGGILSTTVTGGLPKGFYQIASITTDANHSPAVVPVAQHGTLDAMSYFTVE